MCETHAGLASCVVQPVEFPGFLQPANALGLGSTVAWQPVAAAHPSPWQGLARAIGRCPSQKRVPAQRLVVASQLPLQPWGAGPGGARGRSVSVRLARAEGLLPPLLEVTQHLCLRLQQPRHQNNSQPVGRREERCRGKLPCLPRTKLNCSLPGEMRERNDRLGGEPVAGEDSSSGGGEAGPPPRSSCRGTAHSTSRW